MERSNDFLGTERVGRLMGRYAVPCVISLLVGALYNIVDQIFIANASYLGSYGNAGFGYRFDQLRHTACYTVRLVGLL